MEVKVYIPKMINISTEYLPALAQRALNSLGNQSEDISATRGHLVRQAVSDGLLRELDDLINADGTVDLFCDPKSEIPLEIDHHTLSLSELIEAMKNRRSSKQGSDIDHLGDKIVPKRHAA